MQNHLLRTMGRLPTQVARRSYHVSTRSMAKVLAVDNVDELCVKIFQDRGHEVDHLKTMPQEELIKIIGNYDGLVVRSATKVTPEVMQHASKLRIVGRAGVGIDNINVKEATKYGIMVMNTPGGNTVSTAQLTVSLMCSLARHIPAANMSVKTGKWDRKSYMGVEMAGKTLGVIGCGRIGQVVASCAKTMDMKVVGYDPVMTKEQLEEAGVTPVPLEKIWQDSDFITVHTPLTPETANIINDETLAKCRAGVRIVNCARGGIVDEAALLRGLESGRVAGAALDVYTSEPPKEHLAPLISHPNLICTPHLGASTEEAQLNVARDIAVQMCDVFEGKDYVGIVNVSYMAAATQIHMKPFMELSETLGTIVAQMSEAKVKNVEIKTWGGRDVKIDTKQARDLLLAKVLSGIVKHSGTDSIPDLVSAPAMAKELAIESSVSKEMPNKVGSPYWNLVTVTVERDDGTRTSVTGSVFGDAPHVVHVDEYLDLFSFTPQAKYLLTFRNIDRPGVVLKVLEILHSAGVNVANVNVTRSLKAGGDSDIRALCFLSLDDEVPTNALKAIKMLPDFNDVAFIKLT